MTCAEICRKVIRFREYWKDFSPESYFLISTCPRRPPRPYEGRRRPAKHRTLKKWFNRRKWLAPANQGLAYHQETRSVCTFRTLCLAILRARALLPPQPPAGPRASRLGRLKVCVRSLPLIPCVVLCDSFFESKGMNRSVHPECSET